MLALIRRVYDSPVFPGDEDKTRLAGILHRLVLFSITLAILYPLGTALLMPVLAWHSLLVVPLLIVLAAVSVLNRQGRVHAASLLMVAGLWLELAAISALTGGVRAPAFLAFLILIVMAGILLDTRAAWALTGLSGLAGFILVIAERENRLPQLPQSYAPAVWWFSVSGFFAAAAALLDLATFSVNSALHRAHRELAERQRLEQELVKFRLAIERSSEAVFMTRLDGTIIYVNPAFEEMYGYGREEAIGQKPRLIQSGPWDRARREHFWHTLSSKQSMVVELVNQTKDGRLLFVEGSANPILAEDGELLGFLAVQRDVTRRKQAEDTLRANEIKFRSFVEQASDAFILMDEKGRVVEWNRGAERIWGLKDHEVLGQYAWDVQYRMMVPESRTPERRDELKQEISRALATGQSRFFLRAFDVETCRVDGERRFIQQILFPIQADRGYWIGSVTRDVTESKRTEQSLKESEERFRRLAEASFEGIVITDGQRIVDANAATAAMLGTTVPDLIGRSIAEFIPSDAIDALLQRYRESDGVMEHTAVRIDGSVFAVETQGKILRQDGKTLRLTAIRDVTDRKRAEQALKESEDRFRRLAEAAFEGIAISDEGRIVDSNAAFAEMMGYGCGEVVGMHATEFAVPEQKERLARRIRLGMLDPMEFTALKKDGATFPVEVQGRLLPIQGKQIRVTAIRDITERKHSEGQIQRQLQRLSALRAIDSAITGIFDLRVILNIFLDQVTTQLGVDAAVMWLLDGSMQSLQYAGARGFRSRGIEKARLRLGESYAGQVAMERRLVEIHGQTLPNSQSSFSSLWASEGFVTYFGIPLMAKGQVKGVLEVLHRSALQTDQEWLHFLETLATQGAIAVDNATLFSDLQRSNLELSLAYDTTLEGWSRALDLRDKETEGHTLRVVDMTLRLARTFGLRDADLVHLRRGALLHDIGKMGIPDSILLKSGPLTPQEWEIMRLHPVYALELLSPIDFLRNSLDIPYCHHEWWNGDGYPRQLKREEIPLAARLFAVVDVWDALRSDRPYRSAWDKERVRDHIRAEAGTHFDPKVVKAFLPLVERD